MNRRHFLKAVGLAPLLGLVKEQPVCTGGLSKTPSTGSSFSIAHPDFPPGAEIGTRYVLEDGREYKLVPYGSYYAGPHGLAWSSQRSVCLLGVIARFVPEGTWLMTNSGPYTMNMEMA